MTKYLIQVSLPAQIAAKRIDASIGGIGSHFATHAAWRRQYGVATGTLVVEADEQRWALAIVPPSMRSDATIVQIEASSTAEALAPPVSTPYPLAA